MKSTTVVAVLAGAGLLLAGCSQTAGTATAASSTPTAPTTGSAARSFAATASSAAASSAAANTTVEGPPTSTGPAAASTATTSVPAAAVDGRTTVWFTAFCSGLLPVINVTDSMTSLGTEVAEPALAKQRLVSLLTTLGITFTRSAAALKALPGPTFPGGTTFAAQTVTAFETAGPLFTAQAERLAAADVKADPVRLSSALTGLSESLGSALAPLQKLSTLDLTPQTQAALDKIPACKKALALSGG